MTIYLKNLNSTHCIIWHINSIRFCNVELMQSPMSITVRPLWIESRATGFSDPCRVKKCVCINMRGITNVFSREKPRVLRNLLQTDCANVFCGLQRNNDLPVCHCHPKYFLCNIYIYIYIFCEGSCPIGRQFYCANIPERLTSLIM